MPTKSEWERHLEKIYEGKASLKEVADELNVPQKAVSQRYDKFLKELLEEREQKLSQIEKEAEEKERKIKSLSEGIERTEKKLKETEEKLPKVKKLEKMGEDWEQKIKKSANKWTETKKIVRISIIIIGIIIAFAVGAYFLTGPEGAKFKSENLKISSKRVFKGETITVSLDVVNVGDKAGTYKANLEFNNTSVEKKSFGLDAGEKRNISIKRKVEKSGFTEVKVDGLRDNFTAFKSFPFEGAYVKYETEGDVAPFGKASGTEKYKVTEVTENNYTWDFTPTEGIASLAELGIIKKAQKYTTSLETPISIPDDEKWENFESSKIVTENTKFGTMELRPYFRIESGKIHSVYLEENTRIPLRYELVFNDPPGTLIGKLVETNVNYLKEN